MTSAVSRDGWTVRIDAAKVPPMAARDLLDLSLAELEEWCEQHGQPRYRAAQIATWVFRNGVRDAGAMANVPRPLRDEIGGELRIGSATLDHVSRSHDGTRKLLFRLADGATIESVLIPDGARLTLCVSTQVGCGMGCGFCATATLGFTRHLSRGEIVDQYLQARALVAADNADERRPGGGATRGVADADGDGDGDGVDGGDVETGGDATAERITNLVFMGMGEPLHNYDGTVGAIETLTSPWGAGVSPRRITVSTVGLVPEMQRLLAETHVHLAVSLTAVDQDLRRELMPVSRKYSVAELLAACRALPLPRRKRITFEYVMLAGVNDSPAHARALCRALAGIRCKVNLIPFNPFPGSPYGRSDDVTVARFQDVVRRAGIHATVRESRGPDIAAACGQLVAEHRAGTADAAAEGQGA